MRTFHIGGAAQINEQSFVESNFDGKLTIKEQEPSSRTRKAVLIIHGRSTWFELPFVDADGTERATPPPALRRALHRR